MSAVGDECTSHVIRKLNATSYVANFFDLRIDLIINQNCSQSEQLVNQPRIDQRAILAVVAPVEERLLDGHLFVATEQFAVARELEPTLHQPEQVLSRIELRHRRDLPCEQGQQGVADWGGDLGAVEGFLLGCRILAHQLDTRRRNGYRDLPAQIFAPQRERDRGCARRVEPCTDLNRKGATSRGVGERNGLVTIWRRAIFEDVESLVGDVDVAPFVDHSVERQQHHQTVALLCGTGVESHTFEQEDLQGDPFVALRVGNGGLADGPHEHISTPIARPTLSTIPVEIGDQRGVIRSQHLGAQSVVVFGIDRREPCKKCRRQSWRERVAQKNQSDCPRFGLLCRVVDQRPRRRHCGKERQEDQNIAFHIARA